MAAKKEKIKKRDYNILLHLQGEISLSTRKTKNKKREYNRQKFKNSRYWD